MRYFIAISLLVMLAGCTTTSATHYTQNIQNWQGKSVAELVQTWGEPTTKQTTNKGNQLYIYKINAMQATQKAGSPSIGSNLSTMGVPVSANIPNSTMGNTGNVTLNCNAIFSINKEGKIFSALSEGNGC